MAHLWVREKVGGEWRVVPLGDEPVGLGGSNLPPAGWFHLPRAEREALAWPSDVDPVAWVSRSVQDGQDSWALVATPWHVRLNGFVNAPGLAALQDRDEIRIAGFEKIYFATERLASVAPAPSLDRPLACPRCRQSIDAGGPAVCCPACGVWHHETTALPCWTYAERCTLCAQETRLDAGYRWTPEDL